MTNPDKPTGQQKSQKIEARRLKGFRDLHPDLMEARTSLMSTIRSEASLAGFREIGTPALEYLDILLGQGSDETDKQVYKFEDHGGRKVALRFDLTIPFARYVAEYQGGMIFPFKKLQIGDVWRGENTQKGRYREFCQCDLDIIGIDSVHADIEVITCIARTLSKLSTASFTMRLGNRQVLSSTLKTAFPELTPEGETKALIALDKLDKVGPAEVVKLLSQIPNTSIEAATRLLEVLTAKTPDGHSDQQMIRDFLAANPAALAAMDRMQTIVTIATNPTGSSASRVKIISDYSVARGLGYYTGVVFETTCDDLPGFGSVSSGGRYDNLVERFTNRNLPGVGGSIGLDRLLAVLEELKQIKARTDQLLFVAIATPDAAETAHRVVALLREGGLSCDIGMTPGKVGNQFKHADRLGASYVIALGTDEIQSGTYTLKHMKSGEESKGLQLSTIVDDIKRTLGLSKAF
jgi:histidyl-tRNA synthetase